MKNSSLTEKVISYVLKMPDKEFSTLTIKRLTEHFAVSRCHLSRTFHSWSHMTLATFITRQKLLRAERQLLQNHSLTVRALASSLGYADCQHFISRFKEHWGESPGRYRKLNGNLLG